MIDDEEKLKFYLNANFYFVEGVLFSNLVKHPNKKDIIELKKTQTKEEIEKFYNHFHLEEFSYNPEEQRKTAVELWSIWRQFFLINFPSKIILIEIMDFGLEVVIYIYEVAT